MVTGSKIDLGYRLSLILDELRHQILIVDWLEDRAWMAQVTQVTRAQQVYGAPRRTQSATPRTGCLCDGDDKSSRRSTRPEKAGGDEQRAGSSSAWRDQIETTPQQQTKIVCARVQLL